MQPKICLLDIETAPALAWVWGNSKYEQDVIEFEKPWQMLSFAYKWLGEKKVICHTLPDFAPPGKAHETLIRRLWDIFDIADIIVAHNAKYDVGRALAKFAVYDLPPPSPYKVVCTYQLSKKFGFSSRKLDDLCMELGIGRKLPHQGKNTWFACMAGDKGAWRTMKRYNCHDVSPLLEGIYLKFRPYAANHPNLSHYSRLDVCPVCQSGHIKNTGFNYLASGKRQRRTCLDCGHRFVTGKIIRD
jgi:hypothetical protein